MKSIGNMASEPQALRNTIIYDTDTRACEEEHISVALSAEELAVGGVKIVEAFRIECFAYQAQERKRMFDISARNTLRQQTPIEPWVGRE